MTVFYDLKLAPPGKISMPKLIGGAVESARTLSGNRSAINLSGGGLWQISYSNIQLSNRTPDALRYWARLAAILNGGQRSIVVPFFTDWTAPRKNNGPLYDRRTFIGGFRFLGGYVFSGSLTASFVDAAAVNAGTVRIRLYNGAPLAGGEVFEVVHPTKSYRCYQITDVDSAADNGDGSVTYQIAIRPPLREAVGAGNALSFYRPRCVMSLKAGEEIPQDVENFWVMRPSITLIESI